MKNEYDLEEVFDNLDDVFQSINFNKLIKDFSDDPPPSIVVESSSDEPTSSTAFETSSVPIVDAIP